MTQPTAIPERWTVLSLAKAATDVLARAHTDSPRLDADLLLAHTLGWSRLKLYTSFDMPVSDVDRARFRELVKRRLAAEPLAYILRARHFMEWEFEVTPDVLVPRPDTEDSVLAVVELARAREEARILEIGVGSGCIIVSAALMLGTPRHVGTDVSPAALEVARRNALKLGAGELVELRAGDLFGALASADRAAFDVIVSNPPYITRAEAGELAPDVRSYEPAVALYSPGDALHFHREILRTAPVYLRPGGAIVFELPGFGGEELSACAAAAGFGRSETRRDLGGHERVFIGRRE
jgi:release factor glutamine methyltransferase